MSNCSSSIIKIELSEQWEKNEYILIAKTITDKNMQLYTEIVLMNILSAVHWYVAFKAVYQWTASWVIPYQSACGILFNKDV